MDSHLHTDITRVTDKKKPGDEGEIITITTSYAIVSFFLLLPSRHRRPLFFF